MSRDVEYSVLPSRTSGGRYHNVTTSWEYVCEGTDFALARPGNEKDVALKQSTKTSTKVVKDAKRFVVSMNWRNFIL
jgi:hypothetical protein